MAAQNAFYKQEVDKMPQHVCPICNGDHLESVFTLQDIPTLDNVLADTPEKARLFPRGNQRLVQCTYCGFVFNQDFETEKVQYTGDYHAERGHSSYYSRHMQEVIRFIERVKPLQQKRVMEVACGTGEFLKLIAQRNTEICIGVDPSAEEFADKNLVFHQSFFDQAYMGKLPGPVDVLINRHMIEHILDPVGMLRLFHSALALDGILYLETPRLNWIFQNNAFFDFPYEHCAYYTDDFLTRFLKSVGFSIVAMEFSYSGQYFSVCAKKSDRGPIDAIGFEQRQHVHDKFSQLSMIYQNANNALVKSKSPHICVSENVYLWGASAKGVMCSNLLNNLRIKGIIDKNPYKQGKFIPGTACPVLAPSEISAVENEIIYVENPVYLHEITDEVSLLNPRIQVLPLDILLDV